MSTIPMYRLPDGGIELAGRGFVVRMEDLVASYMPKLAMAVATCCQELVSVSLRKLNVSN